MKIRKLALLGLLTAVALTIYLVEAQIPPVVPVPGVKLGLSNIVTVFAVFFLGWKEGAGVLAARIFLGSVFAGNFSAILYSAAGGVLAIGVTIALRRVLKKDQIFVAGALGAAAHALGQMAVAVAVSGTPGLLIFLPVTILSGLVTGCFTGACAQILVKRGGKLWKTFSEWI